MQRLLLSAALGAALIAGCSTPFRDKRTPSGEFCSDMHVVPAGQLPDREYHRLQPIASDPEARTEAERLESLRKAACMVGGDAVIEAVNEEIRTEDGRYASVASGTAVLWVRRTDGEAKPLTFHPATKPAESAAPAEPEAPPPDQAAPPSEEPYEDAPAPAASAPPGKPGQPAKPGAKPSSPAAAAASSAKPSSLAPPSSPTPPSSAKPSTPAAPKK